MFKVLITLRLTVFFMENIKTKFLDYLQLEKNYSLHTIKAYGDDISFFESFLKENYEEPSLITAQYSQIRSWIVALSDHEISSSSINRKISSLKSFFKFLLKTKQIHSSPLIKHKALKTKKIIQIPFSEKELDLVLNQLVFPENFEGVRDKLIIDLFYTTGIRRAELINLKEQNIDIQNSTIKVLGKRNKERIIPILPKTTIQIKNYLIEKSGLQEVKDKEYFF